MIQNENHLFLENDYLNDLKQIKETIQQNQNKAMVVVNSAMIMTYYEIGTIINKRKNRGNKYIQKLESDLKEYGHGYSFRNLKYMSQFSNNFSTYEIGQQPVAQIPWGSIITIMEKSKSHNEMLWYINATYQNRWSRNMVLNQIAMKAYERSLIKPSTTSITKNDELTSELFKDTYVFSFLDKDNIKNEKDLKNQLTNNVIKFLQELGPGFCLVGKEYKLVTPTNEEFYIDLLMYHIKIHAYVVIEVKIGKFNPSDLGQLIFYVNAINKLEKSDLDSDTIGLILCKDADRFVAETTLDNSLMKLGISKYKFIDELQNYLEKKMIKKSDTF